MVMKSKAVCGGIVVIFDGGVTCFWKLKDLSKFDIDFDGSRGNGI